jgi:hypothetical protein
MSIDDYRDRAVLALPTTGSIGKGHDVIGNELRIDLDALPVDFDEHARGGDSRDEKGPVARRGLGALDPHVLLLDADQVVRREIPDQVYLEPRFLSETTSE